MSADGVIDGVQGSMDPIAGQKQKRKNLLMQVNMDILRTIDGVIKKVI